MINRRRPGAPLFGRPWLGALAAGALVFVALAILLGPRPAAPVVESPATSPSWPTVCRAVMPEDLDR